MSEQVCTKKTQPFSNCPHLEQSSLNPFLRNAVKGAPSRKTPLLRLSGGSMPTMIAGGGPFDALLVETLATGYINRRMES